MIQIILGRPGYCLEDAVTDLHTPSLDLRDIRIEGLEPSDHQTEGLEPSGDRLSTIPEEDPDEQDLWAIVDSQFGDRSDDQSVYLLAVAQAIYNSPKGDMQ